MTKNVRHHCIGGTENGKQQKCVETYYITEACWCNRIKGMECSSFDPQRNHQEIGQLLIERANLQQFSKCHSVARCVVHSSCSKQSRWRILCWVSALQQNCRCIIHVFFFWGGGMAIAFLWTEPWHGRNGWVSIDFRSWQCSSKTG